MNYLKKRFFVGFFFGVSVFPLCAFAGEKSSPITISSMKTEVRIIGMAAESQVTMTFLNNTGRPLEKDLVFPLPDGATISGYSLDIKGKMVDGVIIEKNRGRQVFESIVRQGIDPGLAEWVGGNHFRTRIFPILPNKTRTISIRYVSSLKVRKYRRLFQLQFSQMGEVGDYCLRVEVARSLGKPRVKNGDLKNFKFRKWKDGYVAITRLDHYPWIQPLQIEIPTRDIKMTGYLSSVEESDDGNVYFSIHDFNGTGESADKNMAVPDKITIFWDTSNSMGETNLARPLGMLKDFFAQFRNLITVNLVFFNFKKEKDKHFLINRGDAHLLIEEIRKHHYDGGTDLACLTLKNEDTPPDFILLFSDGKSSFGRDQMPVFNAPVYVFSNSPAPSHRYLDCVARQSGGRYYNLIQEDIPTVAAMIGRSPYSFISAEYGEGDVTDLLPAVAVPVNDDFFVTGKLIAPAATVILNFGINGKVMERKTYFVHRDRAVKGEVLRIFWGQKKLDELVVFPKTNKEELLRIGREYGLVTPETSLIVLERFEQYLEHNVMPPKSLPWLRMKYRRMMKFKGKVKRDKEKKKLDRVADMWKKHIRWWEKDFKPQKKKHTVSGKGSMLMGIGVEGCVEGGIEGGVVGEVNGVGGVSSGYSTSGSGGIGATLPAPPAGRRAGRKAPVNLEEGSFDPVIELKKWDPKTPYLQRIKERKLNHAYGEYLKLKKNYRHAPSFYLDCADYFFNIGEKETAVLILSNLSELGLENVALLRILAHKLSQWNRLELGKMFFEKILELRDEEPQSFRDLALVNGRLGDYQEAVKLLNQVVCRVWDRFDGIEMIALMELNHFINKAREKGMEIFDVDPRLIRLLDVDIRIVLTWDADLTDIDLWVIDPRGEKTFYQHPLSAIGGLMSRDFTDGYGPEAFLLKKAVKGKYKILAQYYGNSSVQEMLGAVTLQVDIFTNFGRKNEKKKSITLRLEDREDKITVGELMF